MSYFSNDKYFGILAEPASPVLCNGSKGSPTDKPEPSTNNGKERIMCPVCRTIVVRRVYRRHYETMHCVQAPVTCQFCFKVCTVIVEVTKRC